MDAKLLKVLRLKNASILKNLARRDKDVLLRVTAGGSSALHFAAKLGDCDLASAICELQLSLLITPNSRGDTPLHCAARAGHHDVVSHFIQQGRQLKHPLSSQPEDEETVDEPGEEVPVLWLKNRFGNTALHEAVQNGHLQVVRLLMLEAHGLSAVVNNNGVSPLYMAAERDSEEMVRILLRSKVASHEGPNRQTALHAAVLRSYAITELILSKKPDSIRQGDATTKSTALHYAAANGDRKMVRVLIDGDASTAYLRDEHGCAPIHVATNAGYPNIIEELVQHCPDCVELRTKQGKNFLHVAIEMKRLEVVEFVLKSPLLIDQDFYNDLINEPDDEGNTPMHLAVITRNEEIIKILSSDERVDITPMNNEGYTPLDLAFSNAESGISLRMYKIMVELISRGSRFSPQRFDLITDGIGRFSQQEEIKRYRTLANNLAIVAVLIATVTFAAAFSLPGGYRNNDSSPSSSDAGTAVLANKAAFKVFLVTDALAMVSSITVTIILIYTGSGDHDVRLRSLITAMKLMYVAIGGMITAFTAGVFVVVAYHCKWLAILICLTVFGALLGAILITDRPSFNSLDLLQMSMLQKKVVVGRARDLNVTWCQQQVVSRRRPHGIVNFTTPRAMSFRSSSTGDVQSRPSSQGKSPCAASWHELREIICVNLSTNHT